MSSSAHNQDAVSSWFGCAPNWLLLSTICPQALGMELNIILAHIFLLFREDDIEYIQKVQLLHYYSSYWK